MLTVEVARGQITLPPTGLSISSGQAALDGPVYRRIDSALIIAEKAAESGFVDISQEAVRRALRNGPPIVSVEIGGLLGQPQSSHVTTTRTVMTSINGVIVPQVIRTARSDPPSADYPHRLLKLDSLWEKQSSDPGACYTLWRDIVMPPGRNQIFLFCDTRDPSGEPKLVFDPSPPPTRGGCGARRLVKYARAAGRVSELKSLLDQRELGADPTDLLAIEVSLAIGDNDAIAIALQKLLDHAGMLAHAHNSNEKLRSAKLLLDSVDYESPARRQFYEKMNNSAGLTGKPKQLSWLIYILLAEATAALDHGDPQTLDSCIESATRVAHPANSQLSVRQSTASRLYDAASSRAMSKANVAMALYCLSKSRSSVISRNPILGDSKDLIAIHSEKFQFLFAMPRAERYRFLKTLVWKLPQNSLANLSTFAPTESIPERFVAAYKDQHQSKQLPIEAVCGFGQSSLSLLEWYMRDALALGYRDEIEQELAAAFEQDKDAAILARVVFSLAQDQPIDLSPLIETSTADRDGGAGRILPAITAQAGTPLPLHYDIARAAIADDRTRELGVELAERLAERGKRLRNNIVLYGRHLAALGRLASDSPPRSSDSLQHFVRVDDFRYGTMVRGLPRESIWLQTKDGLWEHQGCNTRSSLLLKYPLVGEFTLHFDCVDDSYASCGATAMGVFFDFKAYSRMLGLDTVGLRKKDSRLASGISTDAPFPIEMLRDSERGLLTVKSNDHVLGKFKVEQESFPFFGAQSMMHRKMALRNFRIEGNYTIPRSVDLITPRLWGWSSLFHVRELPPLGSLSTAGATSVKDLKGGGGPASVKYEWEYDDGELRSVDHQGRYEADRAAGLNAELRMQRSGEEWIYFGRPLCDGETVSFEFYHETGKFSLSPTIDRVAVQLSDKLKEHWITSDPKLFGLSASDYFELPTERVMGAVDLKERDWNLVAFSRADDRITFSINGTNVYWQLVDTTFGGRFGLLCSPEQFHVRVRNATLTGDWPEKLPAELFETTH